MLGFLWRRVLVLAVATLACGLVAGAQAQIGDDVAALDAQVEALNKAGKYAEALPLAEQAIKRAEEQNGPNDPAVAGPLLMLAELLGRLGRVAEGEPHERRALAIREAVLGPDHPDTAKALRALAGTMMQTKRQGEAVPSQGWWESEVALSPA
jgi:hypothetical protein